VKNGEERLVVLNTVARSVVDSQRGRHPEYVFTCCRERQKKTNNSGWQSTRKRAGLSQVRVHDLKHYFWPTLTALQELLLRIDKTCWDIGRDVSPVTYSAAELTNLIQAANQAVGQGSRKNPAPVMLKKKVVNASALTI
jgi:hypothetical protein